MLRRILVFLSTASLLLLAGAFLYTTGRTTATVGTADREHEDAESKPTEWFWRQRAFPHGAIDPAGYRLALKEASLKHADAVLQRLGGRQSPLLDAVWQQRGPSNIGGRVTDLEVHPTNPDVCYAGMATGGVFKTTDGGTTWSPIFDQGDVITVGDLALDPQDPTTLYVGTGEANAASLSFFGNGVYRTRDDGATWENLGLAETLYIARVLVDPSDGQRLWVAATGSLFGTDQNRGVYRSNDAGTKLGTACSRSPIPRPARTWR